MTRRETKTVPGGDTMLHGYRCARWWYSIVNDEYALTIIVSSGDYKDRESTPPSAVQMQMCTTHALSKKDLVEPFQTNCPILEGARCGEGTGLFASDFFKKYGVPQYEQPATFWLALEIEFAEWREEAEEDRREHGDLAFDRCNNCDGHGIVKKP